MRAATLMALLCAASLFGAEYKAGVSRIEITPTEPIWMSGYANRKKPSEGVAQKLWAKALALEDRKGGRVVIVTTDLIGFPRAISDVIGARVLKQYKLDRSRLLLNSSHTHTGPVVRPNLITMYALDAHNEEVLKRYAQKLTDDIVNLVGAALEDLKPAEIGYAAGEAKFAMNRRQVTAKGVVLGVNKNGPVDHSVPTLRVTGEGGKLLAVLFGYACHNTTLGGDVYQLSGDYAGFAQTEVENANPGAVALFLMLCGGDANPNPRGTMENAQQHGAELGAEVNRLLKVTPTPIRGNIKASLQMTELPLAPHERETFEKMKSDPVPARARLAEHVLKSYEERRPMRTVSYPVQAVRFGKDLTILALGGEVVVGYALRAKQEFTKDRLIVAGYSNDVMCYIPTAKMLDEGGYEPVSSMVYYGMPGPFAPEVEDTVFTAIRTVMKRVK